MPHTLEVKYGLTAEELLDAIDRRLRLKVALEGAVAEVHFERKVKIACQEGWLRSYVDHDEDDMHDMTITTLGGKSIRVEVKTIRNGPRPKVELQKTRAATSDPTSRFYDDTKFDVVAVCVGRFTGDWSQFRYALVRDLPKQGERDQGPGHAQHSRGRGYDSSLVLALPGRDRCLLKKSRSTEPTSVRSTAPTASR